MDIEGLVECPVCGCNRYDAKVTGNELSWNKQPAYYFHCANCGAYALNPRMTDDYTKKYYAGTYRDAMCPIDVETLYHAKARARTQIELAGKYLAGKTALDVGCSQGYLIGQLHRKGFTVTGVDPDPDSVAQYADVADLPDEKFDLITCSHTLEHINHPKAFMEGLMQHTQPGTRLMIDVPNLGTAKDNYVFQPHHPMAFDLPSLTWLLEAVGCKVIFNTLHSDGRDGQDNLLVVAEVV